MRPRYSFSSRHTGQAKDPRNIRKQRGKFPELLQKIINKCDIILQVLDARFTEETRNSEVEEEIKKNKKVLIYVVNKSDLVEKKVDVPTPYAVVSCKKRIGIKQLRDRIKEFASKIKKEKIEVGVIGYPNTGKSSLINLLIGKSSAGTGSDAGYTKGIQKLKLSNNIVLLDSPGVIPKKEYTTTQEYLISKHTKVGARSYSQIKNPEGVIIQIIQEFPNVLEKHYRIKADGDSEILLETLGRKLNLLKKGNEVNFDKVSRYILKDWQEGRIKI